MPKKSKKGKDEERQAGLGAQKHGDEPEAVFPALDGGVFVRIQAKPGAKQSAVTDVGVSSIGLQIGAAPKDGEANEELIEFLAKTLSVRRSKLSLDKGAKSKCKIVKVEGLDVETVRQILLKAATE